MIGCLEIRDFMQKERKSIQINFPSCFFTCHQVLRGIRVINFSIVLGYSVILTTNFYQRYDVKIEQLLYPNNFQKKEILCAR